jgi:hypothetical protein
MFLTEIFGNLRVHRESSWRMHANPCQPDLFSISDSLLRSALDFRACLEKLLPLLLWRRGLGRGGRFLTRALSLATIALALLMLPACKPKEIQTLLGPSQALSSVLAEEAARVAGPKKQVALITADASWGPPSALEEALKHALKRQGLTVVTAKAANLGNPMLSGAIGLKAVDFFEALEKSTETGAVISLVGGPLLTPDDTARVITNHPPVLVVATAMLGDKMGVRTDPLQLARLLETQVIEIAIIDGADPVAKAPGKPDPARELFAQNYRILRRPR